jgi:hypothetical protein
MSIPPVGWEENVQIGSAQPSPAPCSPRQADSGIISEEVTTAFSPSLEQTVPAQLSSSLQILPPAHCLVEVSDAPQSSPQLLGARGFLNIVRHGSGAAAIYVVTYRRLDHVVLAPKPVLAEGAGLLIELLARLGVNLQLTEVRGALEDVHRLGSANIPDLWLSEEPMAEKGLLED